MFKQIFNKSDGTPKLIDTDYFDTEQYTDIQPPNGLYQPIHFDGGEWVGTPYEEWKRQQVEVEVPKQDTEIHKDQIIAELSLELIRTQEELNDARKDISDLTIQLLGGTTNA
ncbi:hypothetical protein ABXT13_12290 [Staphylococcus caprae]|uniref:hypothetical protein n=1 Tax=Staphylococcus caprae TaxID=29380 RepID=UPI001BCDD171|nr:hypothetical protein [Staphylococcus caprae]